MSHDLYLENRTQSENIQQQRQLPTRERSCQSLQNGSESYKTRQPHDTFVCSRVPVCIYNSAIFKSILYGAVFSLWLLFSLLKNHINVKPGRSPTPWLSCGLGIV